ncbi:uncharacterized protein LOC142334858 [Convolutriloba macropyga]|uniref:uncharacterized protein LOC142334858 n=1 Tax=Convolutriloba macropyga TaxID=536237 RepID=UPI003F51F6F5
MMTSRSAKAPDCDIHYVNYASQLLVEWEKERAKLTEQFRTSSENGQASKIFSDEESNQVKTELSKLSSRYLTRCLIKISEQKKSLSIMDCQLSSEGFVRVIEALKDQEVAVLKQMRYLETNVPSVLHRVHLITPVLTNIRVVRLRNYIKANPLVHLPIEDGRLKSFYLNQLRLDSEDSRKISEAVTSLCEQSHSSEPVQTTVQIADCVLHEDFRPLFHSATNLTNLILKGSNFSEPAQFLTLVANLKSLKHLDLSYCGLDGENCSQLKEIFLSNINITYLNLSDNIFSDKENELLKSISCLGRLKELHLYHCMLTRSCSTGFDSLLRGGISATLTILSLNFNHFMGNPEVLMAIANCQALEELYLYNAQIMSRNSSSLKQILQQNEKLKINIAVPHLTS